MAPRIQDGLPRPRSRTIADAAAADEVQLKIAADRVKAMPGWRDGTPAPSGTLTSQLVRRLLVFGSPAVGAAAILLTLSSLGHVVGEADQARDPVRRQTGVAARSAETAVADEVVFPDEAGAQIPPGSTRFQIPSAPSGAEWIIEASDWRSGSKVAVVHGRSGESVAMALPTGAYGISAFSGLGWKGEGQDFAKDNRRLRSLAPVTVRDGREGASYILNHPSSAGGLPMRDASAAQPTATDRQP